MGRREILLRYFQRAFECLMAGLLQLHQANTIVVVGKQEDLQSVNKRLELAQLVCLSLVHFVQNALFNQVERFVRSFARFVVVVLLHLKDAQIVEVDGTVNVVCK